MGLCLQTYTDVFDGTRDGTVCDSGKSTRQVVLPVGEICSWVCGRRLIRGGELPASVVECTKLDRDLVIPSIELFSKLGFHKGYISYNVAKPWR